MSFQHRAIVLRASHRTILSVQPSLELTLQFAQSLVHLLFTLLLLPNVQYFGLFGLEESILFRVCPDVEEVFDQFILFFKTKKSTFSCRSVRHPLFLLDAVHHILDQHASRSFLVPSQILNLLLFSFILSLLFRVCKFYLVSSIVYRSLLRLLFFLCSIFCRFIFRFLCSFLLFARSHLLES